MRGEPGFEALLAAHATGDSLIRLVRFAELIEKWSSTHNLVRYANRRELVNRHIVDSLAAAPALAGRHQLLDVGSGAGLPGIPLLVVVPALSGILLEPRQKRWAFLRTVVRELGLEAEVLRARYEALDNCGPFDAITARAVGDVPALLKWASAKLLPGGEVLLWTTADRIEDLTKAGGWRVLSSNLPGLDCGRLARLQPCFT
ncbi:MAG: 16S rRNA (guanine(527)-N(7))-methyltransferase RsmG [Acidobacteria bacterium]|nr:16S rRNA (guanine(527)-N(7))-methyltransferase RsmG [Acidobacteriota bacterium]